MVGFVNSGLVRMCSVAVVARFKALYWRLPGGTEEDHEERQNN